MTQVSNAFGRRVGLLVELTKIVHRIGDRIRRRARGAPPAQIPLSRELLIQRRYVEQRRIGWDFEASTGSRRARIARDRRAAAEIETHLVNAVLTTARDTTFDPAHRKYSHSRCADPVEPRFSTRRGSGSSRGDGGARRWLPGPGDRRLQEQQRGKGNS